ncbi:MAG: hydroxymethylglutaryl-CoA lyase [Marinomonas primoryensis]|jgi:hydroxymethylglutaryl-CoA lyase
MHSANRIRINDVAVRDGFQSEPRFVPTEQKITLINRLSQTGLAKIEATSFVSPKAIPNLRDAVDVMAGITRNPRVVYVALVPNVKGAERAVLSGVDEINLVMSAGEQHNLANMRMSCEQSLAQFREVVVALQGSGIRINGTVATAFGCPIGGDVPAANVLAAVNAYLAMGFDSITLADTTGMAFPKQVEDLCRQVLALCRPQQLTLHFHNTRGMGLANVLVALAEGVTSFDGSLGGIGGCPFAPGATGNICTEDMVHMLELNGLRTGVDLDSLLDIARSLPDLLGHDIPGQVAKAGTRLQVREV